MLYEWVLAQFHEFSARTSVSPSAVPADLTTPEFQFVTVEKLHKHTLYVVILCGLL